MFSERKLSVLQLVPSLNSGGVERGVLEVANYLTQDNMNSYVASSGGALVSELEGGGTKHIIIPASSKNPVVMFNNITKIRQIIEAYNIDIVHARSRAPAWSAYFATNNTDAKFLTTFHGVYNFSNPIKQFYNSIMVKGQKVIAVSNFVKQHIIDNYNVDKKRIAVIQRGVDHTIFDNKLVISQQKQVMRQKYNVPKDKTIILLPARYTAWKGQEVLLKALSLIGDDFYCIMVGDKTRHPAYFSRLKDLVRDFNLQSSVIMAEVEPNIRCLYDISDIVVSASLEPEAFGRTVIEAASMRRLIVATNIGGASETIIGGQTGIHCQANNPEDLADKLQQAINILGSQEHQRLTNNARQNVVASFSRQVMLQKTFAIYQNLAKKH